MLCTIRLVNSLEIAHHHLQRSPTNKTTITRPKKQQITLDIIFIRCHKLVCVGREVAAATAYFATASVFVTAARTFDLMLHYGACKCV